MGVKTFNVLDIGKTAFFEPTEVGYRDSIDIIKDESVKIQKSFVKIGWFLKHIRDNELYREDGYTTIWECAEDQLGYSQSTASRFINICEKFSKGNNSPELDEKYTGFDKSQMIEMLPMTSAQLEKVNPDMTVKEIRQLKNESKRVKKTAVDTDMEDDNVPGQTSIEKDFPEYLPPEEEYTKEENDEDAAWFVEQYVIQHPAEAEIMFETCKNEGNKTVRAKAIKNYIAPNGYHREFCNDYDYTFKSFSAGINFRIGNKKIHMSYKMFVEELMKLMDKQGSEMIDLTNELFDLIESLAIHDRKKIPREEIETLKENALKLTVVIEKLLETYN